MDSALTIALILVGWIVLSIPVGVFSGALLKERAKDYPLVKNK